MGLWDVVRSLLTWGDAAADEKDGRVQISGVPGEPRPGVEVLALNGFYSVIVDGDRLFLMRDVAGGVALGGPTDRPAVGQQYPEGKAMPGDRGIVGWIAKDKRPGLRLRIRGTELEVFGATKISLDGDVKIVRDGDSVAAAEGFTGHTHVHTCLVTGTPVTSVAPAYSGDVGRCVASATKVRAG